MSEHHETPDAACVLALLMTPGVGVVTLNRIVAALKESKTPLRAVLGQRDTVLRRGLSAGLEWTFEDLARCESATLDRATFLYDRVHNTGGQWVSFQDSDYPESVREVMGYNAPPLLTVYGDTNLLSEPGVAIVGSRTPSDRGEVLAGELATWCAESGRVVISGGAQGIDIKGHGVALRAGGKTIFVLPQGVLSFQGPPWLEGYIECGQAVVVSQSLPDHEWSTSAALSRNKTIVAMSRLVMVIDPGQKGGSRRTGGHGLEYERRTLVYAYDKVQSGYPALMREGAYPIFNELGQWDAGYLESHWSSGGQARSGQVDLF